MKNPLRRGLFLASFLLVLFILISFRPDVPITPETSAPGIPKVELAAAALEEDTERSLHPAPPPPPAVANRVLPPTPVPRMSLAPFGSGWGEQLPEPASARFAQWAGEYLKATPEQRHAMEAGGVALADLRRAELIDLIQSHPERAIELAVPVRIRNELPPAVVERLEQRISGKGDLAFLAALAEPGKESEVVPNFHTATFGDTTYEAFVYGRRDGEPTRLNIPLTGIAVDQFFAAYEYPARVLEPEEFEAFRELATAPVCATYYEPGEGGPDEIGLDAGGDFLLACSHSHAEIIMDGLIAAEGGSFPTGASGPDVAETSHVLGNKTLILIRVDFPDMPGAPLTEAAGITLVSNVANYMLDASYGRTTFRLVGDGSAVTPVFRMPQPAAYYGTNNFYARLRSDARDAAEAAGYRRGDYQFDITCFGSVPGWSWAGLGYVGSPGSWLRNSFGTGVTAHELGHNFGLNHASFWDTAGQSVIDVGTSVEYGDNFDTMGSGGSSRVFNARYKNYLNWLTSSEVVTANTNGIYRVFAHDVTNATGIRGLRVVKNASTNYWVEFRQRSATPRWLLDGAQIRWAGNGNQRSHLLDMTPGSQNGKDDSPLLAGRTFSDRVSGIHITVLGKGGTSPESLDIMVNRGSFPNNQLPLVTFTASATNVSANTTVTFTATGTDPDGDELAYFWDFGDGNYGGNSRTATKSWSSTGEYLVRCEVTDMKGGTGSAWMVVRVGNPSTFRISGRVLLEGAPLEGVRVFVSSSRSTFTDSQGYYSLVGLPAGSYTVNANREGYRFASFGFANPVSVGPSANTINFLALPPDGANVISLVPAGSEWKYLDNGSDQGTAWVAEDFDDSLWESGPAKLGYGEGDEVTLVRFGPDPNNKYITTYFRHAFVVSDPREFASLTLGLLRDDGGVVYLNGREVFRSNMPPGPVNYLTRASSAVGDADESTFFEADIDPLVLRAGTNVFAVEIHQVNATSSDMSFDLRLSALSVTNLPRGVFLTNPSQNSFFTAPTNLLLSANASAGRGATISKVEFWEGPFKLGEATELPYTMIWSNAPIGTYTLTATATDNSGIILTSPPVTITINHQLIGRSSVWRYRDNGLDQGTIWRQLNFNDNFWASGPGPLGYGGGEWTVISFGPNSGSKHIAYYFRQQFEVADPDAITNLVFRLLVDDGAVIYMNDREVYRHNMPAGTIGNTTRASVTVDKATVYLEHQVPPTNLVAGVNIMAVQVHQASSTSSDLLFDLEVIGEGLPSRPPLLGSELNGEAIRLFWPGPTTGWGLFTRESLTEGEWAPVEGVIEFNNGVYEVRLAPTKGSQFYLLRRR
jgi:hypothetical protein